MKQLDWTSENDFAIDGVRFTCVQGNYSGKTTKDRFVLLKDRDILRRLERIAGKGALGSAPMIQARLCRTRLRKRVTRSSARRSSSHRTA